MGDVVTYMTCYKGPLNGNRLAIVGKPTSINLEVPSAPTMISEAGVIKPKLARYRVTELVSDPGVAILIYDEYGE